MVPTLVCLRWKTIFGNKDSPQACGRLAISTGNQEYPKGLVDDQGMGGRGEGTSDFRARYAHMDRPKEWVYQ